MGASATLNAIFRTLAHQSAAVDDQIERLKRANRKLGQEQAAGMHALCTLTKPELGADWTGSRARTFQKKRDAAQDKMRAKLTTSVDGYQQRIEAKIHELQLKSDFLAGTSSMAHEASALVHQGEKAADALEHKLSKIKGRLF
jgi:cell division protein ZapA (FtsZ GTPase activity inhibitor)